MSAEKPETRVQTVTEPLYIGMDVGGTKIQTSLIGESGKIYAFLKGRTPRGCTPETTIAEIQSSVERLLAEQGLEIGDLKSIGIAIPGVVEPDTGNIVVTPNMNLSGVPLGKILREYFGIPVAIGNDGNLGTLGETWLGAARFAKSAVGIFVGTGVGSGMVLDGKLWYGASYAAGEIGHIVAQVPARSWRETLNLVDVKRKIKPPVCGCGNIGCLESIASRIAIEHAIQEAVASGVKSKITELSNGDLSILRAGMLARALKSGDKLVTAVMQYTAEVLGYACLTIRHLLDPEVILLGGGVMEACHKYLMPTIDKIIAEDKLPFAPSNRRVVLSSLGDDAVALGAAALARAEVLHEHNVVASVLRTLEYPALSQDDDGNCRVNEELFDQDFVILSDGTLEYRTPPLADAQNIKRKELMYVCGGTVQQLILTGRDIAQLSLTKKAAEYLRLRRIEVQILPLDKAIDVFNHSTLPRAAVFCIAKPVELPVEMS
ncbi:MAG: ROK family protein [Planctomycetia bacterium]|nr:ROK family protein [Planctomycetia bacterium]